MRDGDSAFPSMCLINKGRLISGPFFMQLHSQEVDGMV